MEKHEMDEFLNTLTPEEAQYLQTLPDEELSGILGSQPPQAEEKVSTAHFLNNVRKGKDSTKVGNINDPELDSIRILQDGALFFNMAYGQDEVSEWLKKQAEIILATSLSKSGFLVRTAVTSRTERNFNLGSKSSPSKWGFGKKQPEQQQPTGVEG